MQWHSDGGANICPGCQRCQLWTFLLVRFFQELELRAQYVYSLHPGAANPRYAKLLRERIGSNNGPKHSPFRTIVSDATPYNTALYNQQGTSTVYKGFYIQDLMHNMRKWLKEALLSGQLPGMPLWRQNVANKVPTNSKTDWLTLTILVDVICLNIQNCLGLQNKLHPYKAWWYQYQALNQILTHKKDLLKYKNYTEFYVHKNSWLQEMISRALIFAFNSSLTKFKKDSRRWKTTDALKSNVLRKTGKQIHRACYTMQYKANNTQIGTSLCGKWHHKSKSIFHTIYSTNGHIKSSYKKICHNQSKRPTPKNRQR